MDIGANPLPVRTSQYRKPEASSQSDIPSNVVAAGNPCRVLRPPTEAVLRTCKEIIGRKKRHTNRSNRIL